MHVWPYLASWSGTRVWRICWWIGAVGGNTRDVNLELGGCQVKQIFSNDNLYVALCVNGNVVAWGHRNCTPHGQSTRAWIGLRTWANQARARKHAVGLGF